MPNREISSRVPKILRELIDYQSWEGPLTADKYYYPFTVSGSLSLGRGFLPNAIEVPKSSAITFEIDTIEGSGSYATSFEVVLITNRRQLEESMDWDVKLNVKSLSYSGEAALKIIESSSFTETTTTFVVKAQTEYGRVNLKNISINPEAIRLASENPKEFVNIYGSKVPISKRHGASVYIIVSIENMSETRRKSLNSSMTASVSGVSLSASASANFNKAVMEAKQNDKLKITIFTKGGSGLDKFSEILKKTNTEDFLSLVQEGVGEYFNQFKFDNSAPFGYYCISYKDLHTSFSAIEENDLSEDQLYALRAITQMYAKTLKTLRFYQSIINGFSPLSNVLSSIQKQDIRTTQMTSVNNYLKHLEEKHLHFKNNSPDISTETVDVWEQQYPDYLREYDISIVGTYHGNQEEPDVISDDYYDYIITSKYLSFVRLIALPTGTDPSSAREIVLRTFYSPAGKASIRGAPGEFLVVNDDDNVEKGNKLRVKGTYFSSENFKQTAAEANLPTQDADITYDLFLEVKNSLGFEKRQIIMTVYPFKLESQTTIKYKIPKSVNAIYF